MNLTRSLWLLLLGALGLVAYSTFTGPVEGSSTDAFAVERVEVAAELREWRGDAGERTTLDRRLLIRGSGFFGTSFGPFVRVVDAAGERHEAAVVVLRDEATIEAWLPAGLRGTFELEVENPDRRAARLPITL